MGELGRSREGSGAVCSRATAPAARWQRQLWVEGKECSHSSVGLPGITPATMGVTVDPAPMATAAAVQALTALRSGGPCLLASLVAPLLLDVAAGLMQR